MEEAPHDNGETDSDEEDGEDDFPSDVVRKNVLGCEEQDDADGDEAETCDFVFVSDEADDTGDDNEEGPPAVEKDVETKNPEGVAAENDA